MQEQAIVAGVSTLRQRERIAAFAMYATMAASVLAAGGELLELQGAIDLVYAPEEPLALIYSAILLVSLVVYIGSIIAVGMWIHRAHANLHAAGIEGLQFSPGWAIGWYFVPIALLFKPFQAMRELWNQSHQTADSFSAPAPGTLSAWWGLWIVSNILANVSFRMSFVGEGSNLEMALVLSLASNLCTVPAAWLLMQIMRAITAAQADGIAARQIFE